MNSLPTEQHKRKFQETMNTTNALESLKAYDSEDEQAEEEQEPQDDLLSEEYLSDGNSPDQPADHSEHRSETPFAISAPKRPRFQKRSKATKSLFISYLEGFELNTKIRFNFPFSFLKLSNVFGFPRNWTGEETLLWDPKMLNFLKSPEQFQRLIYFFDTKFLSWSSEIISNDVIFGYLERFDLWNKQDEEMQMHLKQGASHWLLKAYLISPQLEHDLGFKNESQCSLVIQLNQLLIQFLRNLIIQVAFTLQVFTFRNLYPLHGLNLQSHFKNQIAHLRGLVTYYHLPESDSPNLFKSFAEEFISAQLAIAEKNPTLKTANDIANILLRMTSKEFTELSTVLRYFFNSHEIFTNLTTLSCNNVIVYDSGAKLFLSTLKKWVQTKIPEALMDKTQVLSNYTPWLARFINYLSVKHSFPARNYRGYPLCINDDTVPVSDTRTQRQQLTKDKIKSRMLEVYTVYRRTCLLAENLLKHLEAICYTYDVPETEMRDYVVSEYRRLNPNLFPPEVVAFESVDIPRFVNSHLPVAAADHYPDVEKSVEPVPERHLPVENEKETQQQEVLVNPSLPSPAVRKSIDIYAHEVLDDNPSPVIPDTPSSHPLTGYERELQSHKKKVADFFSRPYVVMPYIPPIPFRPVVGTKSYQPRKRGRPKLPVYKTEQPANMQNHDRTTREAESGSSLVHGNQTVIPPASNQQLLNEEEDYNSLV